MKAGRLWQDVERECDDEPKSNILYVASTSGWPTGALRLVKVQTITADLRG